MDAEDKYNINSVGQTRGPLIVLFLYGLIALFLVTYVPGSKNYSTTTSLSAYSYPLLLVGLLITTIHFSILPESSEPQRVDIYALLGFVTSLFLLLVSSFNSGFSSRYILPIVVWHVIIFTMLFMLVYISKPSRYEYITVLGHFIIFFAVFSFLIGMVSLTLGRVSVGPLTIIQDPNYPRLHGWYGNPNRLSPVLAIGALASYYFYNISRSMQYIIYFTVLTTGLLLTGSRGPLISFILSLIVFHLFSSYSIREMLRITYLRILVIVLVIGMIIFKDLLIKRFDRHGFAENRLDIWLQTPPIVGDSNIFQLLFGHGHGYFTTSVGISSHNSYLMFIVDYGLVFTLTFFTYIIYLYSKSIRFIYNLDMDEPIFVITVLTFVLLSGVFNLTILQVRFESFILLSIILYFVWYSKIYSYKNGN